MPGQSTDCHIFRLLLFISSFYFWYHLSVQKNVSYYLKTLSLSLALFIESFFLTYNINEYIKSQKYFSPPLSIMLALVLLLLLIFITNALLAGSWNKWEQYVFPVFPIVLGTVVIVYEINSAYAFIVGIITYLILSYEMFLASQLKRQLIIFNPRWILRFSSKGIILAFSIVAAVLVVISAGKEPQLKIGDTLGDLAAKYVSTMINQEMSQQTQSQLTDVQRARLSSFGLDPSQFTYVENSDLFKGIPSATASQFSVKKTVTDQINQLLEPYQKFVNPIIAILMFGLLQFLGTIAFFLFSLSVELIFWLAKKTGFVKIDIVPAEQEIVHF